MVRLVAVSVALCAAACGVDAFSCNRCYASQHQLSTRGRSHTQPRCCDDMAMGDEGRIEPEPASSTTPPSFRHTHEGTPSRATISRRWWVAGSGAATVAAVTSSFPRGAFADEADGATPVAVPSVEAAVVAPDTAKPPASLASASEDSFPDFEVRNTCVTLVLVVSGCWVGPVMFGWSDADGCARAL